MMIASPLLALMLAVAPMTYAQAVGASEPTRGMNGSLGEQEGLKADWHSRFMELVGDSSADAGEITALIDVDEHVRYRDPASGRTLLHEAASRDTDENWRVSLVEGLLARGVNIHVKDARGRTALDVAIIDRNPSVVKVLVNAGAHFDHKINDWPLVDYLDLRDDRELIDWLCKKAKKELSPKIAKVHEAERVHDAGYKAISNGNGKEANKCFVRYEELGYSISALLHHGRYNLWNRGGKSSEPLLVDGILASRIKGGYLLENRSSYNQPCNYGGLYYAVLTDMNLDYAKGRRLILGVNREAMVENNGTAVAVARLRAFIRANP